MKTAQKYVLFVMTAIFAVSLATIWSPSTVSASTGNWYQDPWSIRTFVNDKASQYGFTQVPVDAGALNLDSATAQKICEWAGYNNVVSMDCHSSWGAGCGFTSCADNFLAKWNTSTNNFDIINGCTAGNRWLSTLVCGNTCTTHFEKRCYNGDSYWYNSCGVKEGLFYDCQYGCQNGSCIDQTIECSSNSQCGANGYTGSPFCQGGDVYQNYKTYTCNNPGTVNSHCSDSTAVQLKNNCTGSQTCQNGSCATQTITCHFNSQCGTNGFTGSPYCFGNNVYKNYTTFTCNNPGTPSSSCSATNSSTLFQTCGANHTCSNGSCIDQTIECSFNSQCGANGYTGSPFCQGGDVYQNYKTYTCNNPGTVNSHCSDSTAVQLKTDCTGNQVCQNGSCSANELTVYTSASPNPAAVNQLVIFSASVSGGTGSYTYSWSGACAGTSQTCSANFPHAGTYTVSVIVTSGSQTKTDSVSVVINDSCISHNYTQCSGNAVYYYNSCGTKEDLIQQCTINQTCQNSQCTNQNIVCDADSDCGRNVLTGNPFCMGNNVFKNQLTYHCNNAGTANSFCSSTLVPQLTSACGTNKTCNNGSCASQSIACGSNAECGNNGLTGNAFCQGDSVYKNYITYACNNPGTSQSYCSNSLTPQLINACSPNQKCVNGSCSTQSIACTTNSQCGLNVLTGSPFCQDGNVFQNYITYTCNNAGTINSSCSNSTAAQLKTTCTGSQTCSNGSCVVQNIVCDSSSDCGTNGYTGSVFCQDGDVYQNYKTYTCNNPGTTSSTCSNSTAAQLKTTCTGSQTCSNGSCGSNCTSHSSLQCQGSNLYWYNSCDSQEELYQNCPNGCSNNSCQNNNNVSVQTNSATNTSNNQATLNGYLYNTNNNNNTYVWFQYGPTSSYGSETSHLTQNYTGQFSQTVSLSNSYNTYHFRAVAQTSGGNIVYGQDMTFTAGYAGNPLTVSKTVRNLTSGSSGFSNTVYASPSDTLMFMITVQATSNQDAQNVFVRDVFPANLVYKNQLVIACAGGSNYSNCNSNYNNYSGDITSGINLSTVYAGQTITITYQAQVAAAQNFSYGNTTLNNSVSVTSSSGYNPTSNAAIIVTRSAVYGASSISTGLTNNFWVDSFFLPLIIAVIGIWMWKSGIFFGIEKWIDNKRKISKGYKSEEELLARIATIRNLEKA